MIIYTCPKCGHDLIQYALAVYPPRYVIECMNCGFKDEQQESTQRIVYKPTTPIGDTE